MTDDLGRAREGVMDAVRAMAVDFHIRAPDMTLAQLNAFFRGEHVAHLDDALTKALALAAAGGAVREAAAYECRYLSWTDGRQNDNQMPCRRAEGYTQDFGPAGDEVFEMTRDRWCKPCKRHDDAKTEYARCLAALEVDGG